MKKIEILILELNKVTIESKVIDMVQTEKAYFR